MKIPQKIVFIITFTILSVVASCTKPPEKKKQLLIYCGTTMIRPMSEIASIIEEKENCEITITKGGSGNLLKSILHNKEGDLYLHGSDKYYKIIEKNHKGLIREKIFVGHNKASIFVKKGNPLQIDSDLNNLTNKNLGVIIGNPDSGSIGKETKKILEEAGIFGEVINNAMKLTTDSKDLLKGIIDENADVVINWYATSTWDDNPSKIDVIEIDKKLAQEKDLILGLLRFSKHPEIARKFMKLAHSQTGKDIFKKYGLYFEKATK